MSNLHPSKRFAVAVSFPGKHRKFGRYVVDGLAEALGHNREFNYADGTSTLSEACPSPD